MKRHSVKMGWRIQLLALGVAGFLTPVAWAQTNPFTAPPSAIDTLSGGSTGPNAAPAIGAANNAAQPAGARAGSLSINLGGFGARGGGAPARPAPAPGAAPGVPGDPTALGAVTAVAKPKIKAIEGTRVFDAVSGELLDDPQITYIEEAEKENYYDDGTHGDLTPEDGVFSNVDIRRDVIGQSNQRIKERLIQAIYEAERLSPVEFFGYSLMTTERVNHPPRNRRWKVVKDANGIGSRMVEVETETPLEVPKFRDKQRDKDEKIAGPDGWAKVFLDEYRVNKDDIKSTFYPMYVPVPPQPPNVAPPTAAGWVPFPNPQGTEGGAPAPAPAAAAGGLGGGMGGFGR